MTLVLFIAAVAIWGICGTIGASRIGYGDDPIAMLTAPILGPILLLIYAFEQKGDQ